MERLPGRFCLSRGLEGDVDVECPSNLFSQAMADPLIRLYPLWRCEDSWGVGRDHGLGC
jgi:hypothetical protein